MQSSQILSNPYQLASLWSYVAHVLLATAHQSSTTVYDVGQVVNIKTQPTSL